MFLLRSIFWLSLAFIVIAPRPIDADAVADAARAAALSAGRDVAVGLITGACAGSTICEGGKALLAATSSNPSAGAPMQDSPVVSPVPFPRPRPDWAG